MEIRQQPYSTPDGRGDGASRPRRVVRNGGAGRRPGSGFSWPAFGALAVFFGAGAAGLSPAQNAAPPPDPLGSLMVTAPRMEVTAPVTASAEFDPPVIAPGGRATYSVVFNALSESVGKLPENFSAPPPLTITPGARGQNFRALGATLLPTTILNYHVTSSATGSFTIPAFEVRVYGRPVTVPAATLAVAAGAGGEPVAPRPSLAFDRTNVFVGQPVRVSVRLPSRGGVARVMSEVELDGEGFLVDRNEVRQQITPLRQADGRDLPTYIYETTITPFVRGPMTISAHGFSSGNLFTGQIVIQGAVTIPGGQAKLALLETEPVTLNVRALPPEGQLPGFAGAIGRFLREPPRLSTNVVRVADPVKLSVVFHGEGGLSHLAMPPVPRTRGWQIYAASPAQVSGNAALFTYTFVPLGEEVAATPEIPFSCFDPNSGEYVDLSIPSMPVKVLPGAAPADAAAVTEPARPDSEVGQKLSLSPLAKSPGQTTRSLVPLQFRGWFVLLETGPVLAFLGLWGWDRRRRYFERHPEILRRRRARRALRRERRAALELARAGDAPGFAARAVQALRVACAPHYPAEPRALVCGDVVRLLDEPERAGAGEMVRRLFDAADAARFAEGTHATTGLIELQPQFERLLQRLEERL